MYRIIIHIYGVKTEIDCLNAQVVGFEVIDATARSVRAAAQWPVTVEGPNGEVALELP